jgi:hypothetical protein
MSGAEHNKSSECYRLVAEVDFQTMKVIELITEHLTSKARYFLHALPAGTNVAAASLDTKVCVRKRSE